MVLLPRVVVGVGPLPGSMTVLDAISMPGKGLL
jgi:hypothetical protein